MDYPKIKVSNDNMEHPELEIYEVPAKVVLNDRETGIILLYDTPGHWLDNHLLYTLFCVPVGHRDYDSHSKKFEYLNERLKDNEAFDLQVEMRF